MSKLREVPSGFSSQDRLRVYPEIPKFLDDMQAISVAFIWMGFEQRRMQVLQAGKQLAR